MEDELGGQIKKQFVGLRAKTHSYLRDNDDKDKKAKSTKKCVIKRKLKFEDYKKLLEGAQIENKTNHLEKNKIHVDSLKENRKEFMKNNKLILKTQNHEPDIDKIYLYAKDPYKAKYQLLIKRR